MLGCELIFVVLIVISLSQTMTQYGKADYWNDRYTRYYSLLPLNITTITHYPFHHYNLSIYSALFVCHFNAMNCYSLIMFIGILSHSIGIRDMMV